MRITGSIFCKQLLLLVLFLLAFGQLFFQGCHGLDPGCFFRKISHTKGESGGKDVDKPMTEKECVQHCADNLKVCQSVDYQSSWKRCTVYQGATDAKLIRDAVCERYEYLCNEAKVCKDRMISMRNQTIVDPKILVPIKDQNNLDGCTFSCMSNPACPGFVFIDNCEIKDQCLHATGPGSNHSFLPESAPRAEHDLHIRARCYNLYA